MRNQNNKSAETNAPKGIGAGQGTSARRARETASDNKDTTSMNDAYSTEGNAGDAVEKAKNVAKTLLDQAKSTAGDAYVSVADKATAAIDEQKAGLTGGLTAVAETARRVSSTISDGDAQNRITEYAGQYTETAAQKLEEAAHYFEQTDLRGIARDVETFARRNPAIFLGSAFALGVLAARFIKSGSLPSIETGADASQNFISDGKWETAAGAM